MQDFSPRLGILPPPQQRLWGELSTIPPQATLYGGTALAAALRLYSPTFNPEITLKALSYFDDGNLCSLPDDLKNRLAAAAREVDLDRLPDIGSMTT